MLRDPFPYSASAAPACVLHPKPILVCVPDPKCALARGRRRNAACGSNWVRVTAFLLEEMRVKELEQSRGKKPIGQTLFIFLMSNALLCRLQKLTDIPVRSPCISHPFLLCIPVIKRCHTAPFALFPGCGAGPGPYLCTE